MKAKRIWPLAVIFAIAAATVLLSWKNWDALDQTSDTIRNIGLVSGGLIAVVLGVWRSSIASRQADTAESDSLERVFQARAEMLGHEDMSVRISGVIALAQLGVRYPDRYL